MMLANRALADKATTVRVNGGTKERAEKMLDEIGISMAAFMASSLKALVAGGESRFAWQPKNASGQLQAQRDNLAHVD